jgi:hypothetical protein
VRLYLDEDTADAVLFKLLAAYGHDVIVTMSEEMSGETDPKHLIRSIQTLRALMTHNHKDFRDLHYLIKAAGGMHPGIPVIRKDNDSARDLSPGGIANAIRKLESSRQVIENEYHTLNQWR